LPSFKDFDEPSSNFVRFLRESPIILKQVEAETNMADFNVDSALKMPTLATVDSDNIRDFLNTIEAFNETIKTSDKKIFIKFITRTKITGAAKTKLEDTIAESFEQLSQQIKSKKMWL
jgi:hypothetical protein